MQSACHLYYHSNISTSIANFKCTCLSVCRIVVQIFFYTPPKIELAVNQKSYFHFTKCCLNIKKKSPFSFVNLVDKFWTTQEFEVQLKSIHFLLHPPVTFHSLLHDVYISYVCYYCYAVMNDKKNLFFSFQLNANNRIVFFAEHFLYVCNIQSKVLTFTFCDQEMTLKHIEHQHSGLHSALWIRKKEVKYWIENIVVKLSANI